MSTQLSGYRVPKEKQRQQQQQQQKFLLLIDKYFHYNSNLKKIYIVNQEFTVGFANAEKYKLVIFELKFNKFFSYVFI